MKTHCRQLEQFFFLFFTSPFASLLPDVDLDFWKSGTATWSLFAVLPFAQIIIVDVFADANFCISIFFLHSPPLAARTAATTRRPRKRRPTSTGPGWRRRRGTRRRRRARRECRECRSPCRTTISLELGDAFSKITHFFLSISRVPVNPTRHNTG